MIMNTIRKKMILASILVVVSILSNTVSAFVVSRPSVLSFHRAPLLTTSTTAQWMSDSAMTTTSSGSVEKDKDDDDDWEYVEFDALTEADLVGSEWLVGTCWDNRPNAIDETWCRLATSDKGENLAIWGDKSEGKWALDQASQYITISKNSVWGKQIWAAVVEDYYYLRGTVRAWTFISPASVEAQWQAKRLGVDPEEMGVAPWFEENDDSDDDDTPQLSAEEDSDE